MQCRKSENRKEIEFIESYRIIEEKRRGDLLKVTLKVDENTRDFSVAPFILFPFIENAFKHGVENKDTGQIQVFIQLYYAQKKLTLNVENSSAYNPSSTAGGIGLNNVKRRLNLLYEIIIR
jgi:LytS/YehU family sensor histidine kinase